MKHIYIPGFLDTAKYRKMIPGLEIWLEDIDPKEKIETEYVVGHSMGADFALINWDKNRNTKLILSNPILLKRNFFAWVARWAKYLFTAEEKFPIGRWPTLLHPVLAIKRLFQLMNQDFDKILSEVPRGHIIIVRGKEDKYLCCEETAEFIKNKGVNLIEVDGASHDWEDVKNEVLKIL